MFQFGFDELLSINSLSIASRPTKQRAPMLPRPVPIHRPVRLQICRNSLSPMGSPSNSGPGIFTPARAAAAPRSGSAKRQHTKRVELPLLPSTAPVRQSLKLLQRNRKKRGSLRARVKASQEARQDGLKEAEEQQQNAAAARSTAIVRLRHKAIEDRAAARQSSVGRSESTSRTAALGECARAAAVAIAHSMTISQRKIPRSKSELTISVAHSMEADAAASEAAKAAALRLKQFKAAQDQELKQGLKQSKLQRDVPQLSEIEVQEEMRRAQQRCVVNAAAEQRTRERAAADAAQEARKAQIHQRLQQRQEEEDREVMLRKRIYALNKLLMEAELNQAEPAGHV